MYLCLRFIVAFSSSSVVVYPFDCESRFAGIGPEVAIPIDGDFEDNSLIECLNNIDIRV